VHVARLAGLPREVTDRAREVLESLSVQHAAGSPAGTTDGRVSTAGGDDGGASLARPCSPRPEARVPPRGRREGQMGLFTEFVAHPVIEEIKALHMQHLTPLEAFDLLRRFATSVQGRG
jgi:DNA mismatch repair ATPase MutS